jgi:hypothetical protein
MEYVFLIRRRFSTHGMSFTDFCFAQFELMYGTLSNKAFSPKTKLPYSIGVPPVPSIESCDPISNFAMMKPFHALSSGRFSGLNGASSRGAYLPGLDRKRFRDVACERARGIYEITKSEAFEIAFDLREK